MDARNRVILPLVIRGSGDEPRFDLASLFLHLLIFKTVIIRSAQLREFGALAQAIGIPQLIDLLRSGAIKIQAHAESIGSFDRPQPDSPRLVQLTHLRAADQQSVFEGFLASVEFSGATPKQRLKLHELLLSNWLRPNETDTWGSDILSQTTTDVSERQSLLLAAVNHETQLRGLGRATAVEVEVETSSVARFHVRAIGVADEWNGAIARKACLTIAHLNSLLADMKRHTAVASIADDSQAFLERRIDAVVWNDLKPDRPVGQFRRIIETRQLPDFETALQAGTIDVRALLRVRESKECREFRIFLREVASLTDDELADRLASIRSRLGTFVASRAGKVTRLLATTAVGLAIAGPPGLALGMIGGVLDSFLVEKLFPADGVVTFLGEQYPSIFDGDLT